MTFVKLILGGFALIGISVVARTLYGLWCLWTSGR